MLGGWVGNGWVGRWVGGGRGELGRAASEEGARQAMGEARVVVVMANLALLPWAALVAAPQQQQQEQQQQEQQQICLVGRGRWGIGRWGMGRWGMGRWGRGGWGGGQCCGVAAEVARGMGLGEAQVERR